MKLKLCYIKFSWGASKLKEAGNIANSWTKSMENTVKHFCTTAERVKKTKTTPVKNVDWKKIAGNNVAARPGLPDKTVIS